MVYCCKPKLVYGLETNLHGPDLRAFELSSATSETGILSESVKPKLHTLHVLNLLQTALGSLSWLLIGIVSVLSLMHPQSMECWRCHAVDRLPNPWHSPTTTRWITNSVELHSQSLHLSYFFTFPIEFNVFEAQQYKDWSRNVLRMS